MTNVDPHNAAPRIAGDKSKPLVVLVIEDDPFFRDVMVEALERAGFQTLSAENGAVGLKIALAHMSVRLGASAAISKPFLPSELVQAVRKLAATAGLLPPS